MIVSVKIKFDKLLHDTGRAILIRIGNTEYWLGYFMFTHLIVNNKLGGNLIIKNKYADEKGIYYDEKDAAVSIQKHVPKKITKKPTHDEALKRSN